MPVPFHLSLKNQVAVITGGGGILCSVMAKALAECGAKVAILDLKPDMAQEGCRWNHQGRWRGASVHLQRAWRN